jgi:hypothetical protein
MAEQNDTLNSCKFTFKDWMEGNVILTESSGHYHLPKVESIPKVCFSEFSEFERELISQEQRRIFSDQIKENSERVIEISNELLANSKDKSLFLKTESSRLRDLFKGEFLWDDYFATSRDFQMYLDQWTYQEILNHYQNHYVRGKSIDYSHIPSEALRDFQKEKVLPEVHVYVFQNLLKHLDNLDMSQAENIVMVEAKEKAKNEIKNETKDEIKDEAKVENSNVKIEEEEISELEKLYRDEIFENEFNYKFFKRFAKRYVNTDKRLARYSTIYYILKENYKYKLISPTVKNSRYAKFLCDIVGLNDVSATDIKKEITKGAELIFNELLSHYNIKK